MSDQPTSEHENHRTIFTTVFVLLCALTALSFWVSRSHLMVEPVVGWTCMMAVSVAKAILVLMVFMHLWWEKKWKYVLTVPAMIMGTLLVLLLVPDIGFRNRSYPDDRRAVAAEEKVLSSQQFDSKKVETDE